MTQEQALEEFKAIFPVVAGYLAVERMRKIGYKHGSTNMFYLWNHVEGSSIVASSERSFEHALAIAKSGNENIWPEDDSPVEFETFTYPAGAA